jgi:predicted nucleotidyltransferase
MEQEVRSMEKNSTAVLLQQLGHARDTLLARVTQVLERNPQVGGAWLSGSFGRGEADEWSDLDLHVAVEDEHLPAFLENYQTLFAEVGRPLLVFGGIPSNSMPGGHFWLVQYEPFMLEIDWNIGPVQEAVRPEASLLLFDRVGIPITTPPPSTPEAERRAVADKQLSFFWAMAPIAIKFAGRGHTRLAVDQVDLLVGAFIKLWHALYHPERLQKDVYHQNRPLDAALDARLPRFGSQIDPVAALDIIRMLCKEVEALHPALAEMGAFVAEDVVAEVVVLAELAEPVARRGGSVPNQGSRR